ncbi:MAG: hypothetical protein FXF49_10395 [Flexistipes sinusarabici]|uniref:General secretion pathway protein M n=1 Tax=Flexistipes sinusarabici TaxID=2352 RepID=A0A5D0MI50_FLESI|nr:hypothetical protein [Flexistipes sinusarabici]TYB32656.1 MAG: hypothetical protein FXF49_10395 [Flexistipes sinusarabici]
MKQLFNNNRETLLYFIIAGGAVFLLFYWTHLFFQSKIESMKNETETVQEKVIEAEQLLKLIRSGGSRESRLDSGLLTFVQNMGKSLNIENKIISVKPKSSSQFNEAVTLKIENLNLNEILNIIQQIDKYSNLIVTSLSLDKRYDNPGMANMAIDMGKQ